MSIKDRKTQSNHGGQLRRRFTRIKRGCRGLKDQVGLYRWNPLIKSRTIPREICKIIYKCP